MPSPGTDKEPIYVFELDETYLFSYFFDRTDIFAELQEYYNDDEYRFEVPVNEFSEVQDLLESNFYKPIFVEDIAEFTVVKEQYTEHASILRESVMHWSRRGYNFFIMQDPQAVEYAIEQGATRLEDTDLVSGL